MSEYQILIVGTPSVGKSALTMQFVQNQFFEDFYLFIEENRRKLVEIDGGACMLDIFDTATHAHEKSDIRDQFIMRAQGLLCVYSITSRESFDAVSSIRDVYLEIMQKDNAPMVLVGNKCDLADRQVPSADGEELAREFDCPFFETSAKTKLNVKAATYGVVREIRKHNEVEVTPAAQQYRENNPSTCTLS
mmetsp:Transcript_20987/g.26549  ORF Transcript_20987/g.26549 Transcript_20987/m.26549 type:complete len:191 (-) Transcript_20987:25-597(-)